jgi:hypothetical protein
MNTDGPDDGEFSERVAVTRSSEIARVLGRIEQTLIDMRRDIQAGTLAQGELTKQLVKLDRRVFTLESNEETRKLVSRVVSVIALAVVSATLVPAIKAADQLHDWFDAVDKLCFNKSKINP